MSVQENRILFRYVSNAGVLVWDGLTGLGVDVFCRDENGIYKDLQDDLRDEIFSQIRAGSMNAMIITHEHSDHFLCEDVARAWEADRKLKIFSTEAVTKRLRTFIPADHLITVQPPVNYEPQWIEIGDFRVGLMTTVHEGAQYSNVQNLCVFLENRGKRIVITGDALPDEKLMSAIRNWTAAPDLAFVPFPLIGLKKNRRLLSAYLDIKQIIAYHLPIDNVNVNWVLSAKAVCAAAVDGLVDPVFAEKTGKWFSLKQ